MAVDLLEVALRNKNFSRDVMANPDLSNKAIAIIDRLLALFGNDIHECKIDGPLIAREGFDVSFRITSKGKK